MNYTPKTNNFSKISYLSRRKRKLENGNDSSSASSVTNESISQPTKKYHNKHSKMIVSSPPYAEPSASSSDVFFGRWQATTPHHHHQQQQQQQHCSKDPSSSLSTPPPATTSAITAEETEYKRLTSKFKYQYPEDHAQAFPSPESTIYNTIPYVTSNTSTPRSISWGYRYNERDAHSRSLPRGSWPILNSNISRSSPELITTAGHFTDSPPSMTRQLPHVSSLARYHTCSDTRSNSRDNLPTPPSSITELHQNATGAQSWGTRLPPLRAIMNNLDQHMNKSSLFPLLLPPPPPLVAVHAASSMNEQHNYPYYR